MSEKKSQEIIEKEMAHQQAGSKNGGGKGEMPSKGELSKSGESAAGMRFENYFSKKGLHPFDEIEWEKRDARIQDANDKIIFEQKGVEVPKFWSQIATNVVVSKYFNGKAGTPQRENSIKQLVNRVSRTIADWGIKDGYFASDEDGETFYKELTYLLVNQYAAFNSPVWFNVGIEEKPQCSACFINSVEDTMSSILDLAKIEGMLFKYGSGTGTNFSSLRSSRESLSGGGIASGPVSFMKGFDAFAGVIKSGGRTRRAAKMVILNVDHPDIEEFINCKANEEKKAWALIDAGYDGAIDGEAYTSIFFQNANHSVRATNEFMKAVEEDQQWVTKAVSTGEQMDSYRARDLMYQIADSTHVCGDPGMQFDTTINDWHTCPNSDRINASNPCSEYMFVDNTACNLASLNLMKFLDEQGRFNAGAYKSAVRTMITAMEIIVDNSSYPRKEIAERSHLFRTLGLGYANLGALLMSAGLPYDSNEGRSYAAAVTSIMCGEAYKTSAEIAKHVGPFAEFPRNREPMLRVIKKHQEASHLIEKEYIPEKLFAEATSVWDEAYEMGEMHGYRNAQVTVLAPTGTIAFMMDCDTTGIEPDIALIKYKKLVGGGGIKIINNTVPTALKKLGYDDETINKIITYIHENETIEGAPQLKDEHLAVFDCAFKPKKGIRSIHYMGHVKMMAAAQPFISGAISKTVNVPETINTDEIMDVYRQAWKLGLKAIAIYRDNSKRTQPLSTSIKGTIKEYGRPYRRRLPDERKSITHKFSVGGHEGYITVGMYEDGSPGEIFITQAKEGSFVSGLMDAFATAISMALQYGVPLSVLCNKFTNTRFEPQGFTNNKSIPMAKSVMDYIFKWLAIKFLPKKECEKFMDAQFVGKSDEQETPISAGAKNIPFNAQSDESQKSKIEEREKVVFVQQSDAPNCSECGNIMVRSGNCYKCIECGSTTGCG